MKKKNSEEYERILKLKQDFEDGNISQDEISEEDAKAISAIYNIEIANLKNEISEINDNIEEYKNRMKSALEYLKKN